MIVSFRNHCAPDTEALVSEVCLGLGLAVVATQLLLAAMAGLRLLAGRRPADDVSRP